MEKEQIVTIGKKFVELRRTFGFNQSEMSERLGISRAHFSKMERGHLLPNPKILHLLRTEYNVSLDWLLLDKGPMMLNEDIYEPGQFDFGEDNAVVEKMLKLMSQVPMVRYAVLSNFLEYCKENQEVIDRTLTQYKHYRELKTQS